MTEYEGEIIGSDVEEISTKTQQMKI